MRTGRWGPLFTQEDRPDAVAAEIADQSAGNRVWAPTSYRRERRSALHTPSEATRRPSPCRPGLHESARYRKATHIRAGKVSSSWREFTTLLPGYRKPRKRERRTLVRKR